MTLTLHTKTKSYIPLVLQENYGPDFAHLTVTIIRYQHETSRNGREFSCLSRDGSVLRPQPSQRTTTNETQPKQPFTSATT